MYFLDVSIIIVNYKTPQLVLQCLESVFRYTNGLSFEVIIVDNSCDESEYSQLKRDIAKFKSVIFMPLDCNAGFGSANNDGAAIAKGKYLFFLNSDTLLINNAIFYLWSFLNSHDDVGIVGSNLFSRGMRPAHSFIKNQATSKEIGKKEFLLSSFFCRIFGRRQDFNYSGRPIQIRGYVCGAALMIRHDLFDDIGGFDKRIFMYAEEALLCFLCSEKK